MFNHFKDLYIRYIILYNYIVYNIDLFNYFKNTVISLYLFFLRESTPFGEGINLALLSKEKFILLMLKF